MKFLFVQLCALVALQCACQAAEWGYDEDNGPSTWGGVCKSGKSQSPVDIQTASAKCSTMPRITFSNYGESGAVTLHNNGHSAVVDGFSGWSSDKRPHIKDGGLGAKYLLEQFHFHWASSDSAGTEHKVNGKQYPSELHMVHIREGLTLEQALAQSNGVAVVGVVFYSNANNGTAMAKLEAGMGQIVEPEASVSISGYKASVHLPGNLDVFYRYNGSLTTPECNESVVWTVYDEMVSIQPKQLSLLRAIKDEHGKVLASNVRPVQALNGRTVYARKNKC